MWRNVSVCKSGLTKAQLIPSLGLMVVTTMFGVSMNPIEVIMMARRNVILVHHHHYRPLTP